MRAYAISKGDSQAELDNGTEDYVDYAVNSYAREFLLSLTELDRKHLLLVEEALNRIDRGEYGYCQQCGEDVAPKRLEVQPWARHCVRCQELEEKGCSRSSRSTSATTRNRPTSPRTWPHGRGSRAGGGRRGSRRRPARRGRRRLGRVGRREDAPPALRCPPRAAPRRHGPASRQRRIAAHHPWVFSDDVAAANGADHGDSSASSTTPERFSGSHSGRRARRSRCGWCRAGTSSPIVRSGRPASTTAIARRGAAVNRQTARRLVFGEGDHLPGLVADLYGTHLVVQTLTAGPSASPTDVVAALRERVPIDSVLARNDPSVRTLEGPPARGAAAVGDDARRDRGRRRRARPTRSIPGAARRPGAFLDQRDNRIACRAYARGRVLDAFAYHASFALHAARSASEVVAVDASADALARGRANAERNGANEPDVRRGERLRGPARPGAERGSVSIS